MADESTNIDQLVTFTKVLALVALRLLAAR